MSSYSALRWLVACFFLSFPIYLLYYTVERVHSLSIAAVLDEVNTPLDQRLLERNHVFVPANDTRFEYAGRWFTMPCHSGRDAGFPGSSIEFEISSTSNLFISLGKKQTDSKAAPVITAKTTHSVFHSIFWPHQQLHIANAASVFVTLGDKQSMFFHRAYGVLQVKIPPTLRQKQLIRITYLGEQDPQNHSGFNFQGIWIDRKKNFDTIQGRVFSQLRSGSAYPTTTQLPSQDAHSARFRGVTHNLELFSSLVTSSGVLEGTKLGQSNFTSRPTIEDLLQSSLALAAPITTVHVPARMCLTARCKSLSLFRTTFAYETAMDLYFRSGSPGSSLHNRPWSYSSISAPGAIVLEVGFWDFDTFLSISVHRTERSLRQFTVYFIEEYIKFIANIRRNLPRQSSNFSCQSRLHLAGGTSDNDKSFKYNSMPSTTPIFLLYPPLPASFDSLVGNALFEALVKVQEVLQTREGDRRTFFIDTTGWLNEEDYQTDVEPIYTGSTKPFNSNVDQSDQINRTIETDPASPVIDITVPSTKDTSATAMSNSYRQEIFHLTLRARKKVALFLSLHLCPYLSDQLSLSSCINATFSDTLLDHHSRCSSPSNPHTPYIGQISIPDDHTFHQNLQQRKIDRLKNLFPECMWM